MAKKVTIQGRNKLENLEDDWGGVNDTTSTQNLYGTDVPPGAEWGMNRGEVERFLKAKLAQHEGDLSAALIDIAGSIGEAIVDVVEGEPNPTTKMKKLSFYKASDTERENPIEIEVLAGETGVTKQPKITVSLNTGNSIKKGDAVDFDWIYDFVYTIAGEVQDEKELPYSVNIKIKSGNTVYYDETIYGDGTNIVPLQSYNVRYVNPSVTGNVEIVVTATVIVDGEVMTATSNKMLRIVEMRLSTDLNPATQLAISGGVTDGQIVSVPYSYTVPNGTTLRVYVDGEEPITSTINGSGRNFVTLQASELSSGRHNIQMIAENNGLLSDAVIVDFLKAGGTDDYLGLRLSVPVGDADDMPLAYAYGESELPLNVEQFGNVSMDFAAWNQETLMSEVKVYVDGGETPVQVLSAERTLLTLRQRFDVAGSHTMEVAVGTAVMGFAVTVIEAAGITETETPGYVKKLSANGRSNSEANPADWGGIVEFDGVNWNNNGWNTDSDGVTSLLLTNGAKATVDIKPFVIDGDYSIQLAGMAFGMKLKVSHVMERGASIVRCLYDNGGEGYPMGLQVTTEKAGLLFGGKEEIVTAEDLVDEDGNYIDYDGNIVTEDEKVPLVITRPFGVEMNIALDQWIDIYYVVQPSSGGYGLGMLYINGVLSRANRYSGALIQNIAQKIVIDSDKADVRVRGLYYYRYPLIADEVLSNVIINQHTVAEMQAMHAKNAVGDSNNTTDADGNIAVNRDALLALGRGVLTIIRSSDTATEGAAAGSGTGLNELFRCVDKKQNFKADLVRWEPPLDASGNPVGDGFEARNVRMRIQGTSSVKYPYKNLRIYLTTAQDGVRSLSIGGVDVTDTANGYPLRGADKSVAQAVLCAKTDFVDSSLAGNTGGAHLFDYTMQALGLLTPPQQYQSENGNITVRQAVDGIPCDIFAATSENGTLNYCGQFVLNNEKSKSGGIFGMDGIEGFSGDSALNPYSIALEALDNNSPMTLFHPAGSADSEELDEQLSDAFNDGFEFNYPEDATWATIGTGDFAAWNGAKDDIKQWLGWIYDCMADTDGVQDGTMTIEEPDYGTSAGWSDESRAKWVSRKFKDELAEHFDKNHLLTYYLFIDYLAGKDQLAKNILWRCWDRNIWYATFYDGDTWEAIRNDAFLVYLYNITRESYDSERSKYAFEGHSSWLWCLVLANFEDDIRSCAERLRNQLTTQAMLNEFVGNMIGNWSERQYNKSGKLKYVDTIDNMNYVYTLTGNREAHITSFLTDRARLLDAKYAVGQYNGDVITFTVVRNASDAHSSLTLRSGELYFFGYKLNGLWLQGPTQVNANASLQLNFNQTLATNDPLMLGGASCIKELDFTNMGSQLNGTVNLSLCAMLTKLVMPATNGAANAPLTLGGITKLEYIDITGQSSVHTGTAGVFDVSAQSRLSTLLAGNTNLTTVLLPEGAPVTTLTLPASLTTLKLRYLPNLTASGLTLQGTGNIKGFNFASCPNLDWKTILASCTNVRNVRVEGVTGKIDPDWLEQLAELGGYDADGNTIANPALVGSVVLTKFAGSERLSALRRKFIYLQIEDAPYSIIEFDDTVSDPENISNLDNETGYKFDNEFVASGHALEIRKRLIPVSGRLQNGVFKAKKISESNYREYADGTAFDYGDTADLGNDSFMRIPHCWYKGINDFKNEKKYICWSSMENEPISTASRITRKTLSEILYQSNCVIKVDAITDDDSTIESDGVVVSMPNHNVYRIDVEGMKQVRWPGLNSVDIGACFVNDEGIIISHYNMAKSGTMFDFVNGDYIFIDVPSDAKWFFFTSYNTNDILEAIAVDSDEIEAIEPDWVENDECLGGIYQASLDGLRRPRSISGATVRTGTGTSTTSAEWLYDANGNPTNTPTGNMYWTGKDFQNLSRRRGTGYQLFDYEMSKFVANLYYSVIGNRDATKKLGAGKSTGGATGYLDSTGNSSSTNLANTSGSGNKCLGFESFFGCTLELMDMIAVNVPSFHQAYLDEMKENITSYPINAIYHIYDPIRGTERTVQGITDNGKCIARVKNGRFCDVLASKCSSDSSVYAANYCDANYYSHSRCRIVGRSVSGANVSGGVAYAHALYVWSSSYTSIGFRLAFRGLIEIEE